MSSYRFVTTSSVSNVLPLIYVLQGGVDLWFTTASTKEVQGLVRRRGEASLIRFKVYKGEEFMYSFQRLRSSL